jgi:PAS domain S-box-containing protein
MLPAPASGRAARARAWLALAPLGLSLLALVGHFHGISALYGLAYGTPMAPHAAAAILLASAAVAILPAEKGPLGVLAEPGAGGSLARRWLLVALAIPFAEDLVAWLAARSFGLGPEQADAVGEVALAGAVVCLLLLTSHRLEAGDRARGRAFDALRRSEAIVSAQLDAISHHASDMLLLARTDGTIVQANERALAAYGYSRQEMLGMNVRALRDPGSCRGLEEDLRRVFAGDRMRYETVHRRRDGSSFPVEMTARRLEVGGRTIFQGILRDLTEQHSARAALEYRAMLLDNIYDAVIGSDSGLVVREWNTAAERIYGWTRQEALGRHLPDLIGTGEGDGSRSVQAVQAEVDGAGRARAEVRRRGRDGQSIDLETTVVALRDAAGAVQGYVSVSRDITQRKRAEEALRASQAQLLQSQKMEAVGQLASGIAHDFNNLLVVILSNARFLLEALPPGDERREDAEAILDAGERGAGLVRQLLTFGRKGEPRRAAADVGAVVRGIDRLLRRAAGPEVQVSVELAPGTCAVRIDTGQVEQVLMNLVVNARDAMPEGGEIRVATRWLDLEEPPPDCPALRPGRYAALAVADTGCGMTPEVAARVFEPFFTTKESGKGTGLGLSTVYGIAKRSGGDVAVSSEPGRGTTFTVYLPACAPAAAPDLAAVPGAPRAGP